MVVCAFFIVKGIHLESENKRMWSEPNIRINYYIICYLNIIKWTMRVCTTRTNTERRFINFWPLLWSAQPNDFYWMFACKNPMRSVSGSQNIFFCLFVFPTCLHAIWKRNSIHIAHKIFDERVVCISVCLLFAHWFDGVACASSSSSSVSIKWTLIVA